MHFIDQNINTRNHVSLMRWSNCMCKKKCRTVITNVKQRLWKNIYKKKKWVRKKMKKWKSGKWKTRKSRKSRNSQKNYSEFSILPYSQNQKLGFKNLGKNVRDFRDFRGFRVFDLAKKNYLFMFLIILFFSISPLQVTRCLPCIIRDDSSELHFRTAEPMRD